MHEKAMNDYAHRFKDGLAEACVADMLRGRAVCPDGVSMLALMQLLRDGFQMDLDGQIVRLELLRAKNKCGRAATDPSHFRNVLCNLKLTWGGVACLVELQVHHRLVYAHNEDTHAHDHYEYFRSQLKGVQYKELDPMLERVLDFLDEVSGVPVLLSMLIVVLAHRVEGGALPINRRELYDMAIKAVLNRRVWDRSTSRQHSRSCAGSRS